MLPLKKQDNIEEISIQAIELPRDYVHDHLNQEIWDGETLRPEIQEKLEQIAKDFHEYIEIDVPVKDIWFTGSLANYNWTDFSDVDLHILIDYNDIEGDDEFIRNYLGGKKTIWNDRHDIKMRGFDVELYAQDTNEPHRSTGVYSVMDEDWVRKPSFEKPEVDRESIKEKVKSIADRIEEIEKLEDPEKTIKKGEKLKDKIKNMRQSGLERAGEFSTENLAFKYLRNNGYIERLFDAVKSAYDNSVSITEEEEKSATFEFDEKENYVLADEVLSIVKSIHRDVTDFDSGGLTERIYKFPFYELTEIPINTLNTDEFLTDPAVVQKYVEKTQVNPDYPPIVYDPYSNSIIDGLHRVRALENLGHDTVRAYVGKRDLKNQETMSESIRQIVRSQINEFFNSAGFHASMDDWLKKWAKKGINVDAYGEDGVDMGFRKGTLLSEETGYDGFDPIEVMMGVEVEMEHTDDRNESLQIALEHLRENGEYYSQAVECGLVDEPKALEIYEKHFAQLAEEFKSKAQQRYFYAMADKPGKKGKEFKKWAKEFSDDTDFDKLPEKVTEDEQMFSVSPIQHKLFLEKNLQDEHGDNVDEFKNFILFCCTHAGIDKPTIVYIRGTRGDDKLRTTASYNPNNHNVHVYSKGRHKVDVMRSIAHELMHMKQELESRLHDKSGEDGSPEENEAHSFSGLMIRKYGREEPGIYEGYTKKGELI